MEPMEKFFAGRFALRRSADGRALDGTITFTPDLQGPPDRAHGGGVAAACLRVAAELLGGAQAGEAIGGSVGGALPLGITMSLKEEFPLGTAVKVEAQAAGDAACALRLVGPKGVIAEASGGRPPGPPPDPQPATQAVPNPLLTTRLQALIAAVERAGDQKFRHLDLWHGLRVEVGIGSQFNLRLSRAGVSPSPQEWRTVLAYLPARCQPDTGDVAPRGYEQAGRGYLEAHWPALAVRGPRAGLKENHVSQR